MKYTPINDVNFLLYAAKHYDSPFPDTLEFYEDLKRIVYIKRLFNIYVEKKDLKERLVLNHLIILYNVFGYHVTPMLFLKLQGHESILKTFLTFLSKMPDTVEGLGIPPRSINNSEISMDPYVWQKLSTI